MIKRYNSELIDEIWSDDYKYKIWWEVELAVCEAWNKINVIPNRDLALIKKNATLDIKYFLKLEKETKHDIVAFTRMISKKLGPEKKWIHLGLTSTDIVDTAQNFLIKKSNEVILQKLITLQKTLKKLALQYQQQIIMGRSHGIFAEPTSLGLKFLLWYEEITRQIKRLKFAASDIEIAKISSSMGNFAHLELSIEAYVAKKFDLGIDLISTQVTQRDRHIGLFCVFANISSTLEKMAIEIRLLQRSEVNEILEGFSKNQKGSSSMPHKRNPIGSENISGLARLIRTNAIVTFENNLLWHERDISHSSNERIIIPDTYSLLDYTLNRFNNILSNLVINKEAIEKNIEKANGIYFSQVILSYIIKNNKNITREEIYDFIQKAAKESIGKKTNFKQTLINLNIEKYILLPELNKLLDVKYFLRNVDKIYKRVLK